MFFVFFSVFSFFLIFSRVLYYFLFDFYYIFNCFSSYTAQRTTRPRIGKPVTLRKFSVLTRLKNKIQEFGRLPRSELPFLPVLRALFRASTRRGVLVNGSADHYVKKNNTHKCHENIYVTFTRKYISTGKKLGYETTG